ncbi:magnesium transporter NIPA-domain-containing protein [Cantharellus anzutake]|uniref:magnesium transporter NIPA-domain-containing protein n=1 Tax=Cantharellus anzutake TaxID=1750568 RepID=UPI001907A524|nr:magnesium transporter NIPA-domain-containing protein [Cantharellus anzutake]KAF8332779.1 magnesium transporter NIPA-domain-containing protein [Cantharellus anzutake]
MSSFIISARAAESSTSSAHLSTPPQFKVVGVLLAVISGVLIGSSFVFKKKGLQSSQETAGEGVAYLKSPLWWTGMIMMILGEICNFGSYAFIPAIIVTPLGALSVVICAILSSIFLEETLTFFGWIGCFLCIVGSVIIALNGPQEQAASTISEFQHLFLSLGFIIFGSLIILTALVIIFFFAPKYGKKNMLWYILVCSLFGGLSVSCTQGLGSSIVTTARGQNQFKYWFMYFLIGFVAITLVTEIYFLNLALALFNTAMVTPTYYVIFTFFTLVTSVVLYQGLHATVAQIITVVMAFLIICAGITLLQMSKVDPTSFSNLDRKTTLLLQASRQNVEKRDNVSVTEDPGMDALRGSFGAFGSIIRAKSVSRINTTASVRNRRRGNDVEAGISMSSNAGADGHNLTDLPRLQLYDTPMPSFNSSVQEHSFEGDHPLEEQGASTQSGPIQHRTTIKFKETDAAYYYHSPGKSGPTIHEKRTPGRVGASLSRESLEPISEHDKRSTVHLDADEAPPMPHERFRSPPPTLGQSGWQQENGASPNKHRTNTASSEQALLPSLPLSIANISPIAGDSHDDLLLSRPTTPVTDYKNFHPITPSRSINRSYPGDKRRTSSEDEMEAHESLVSQETDEEDADDTQDTPTRNRGGVRLVNSKTSTPKRI